MSMEGYLTTVDQAEEFFRRCGEKKAETLEERLEILRQMGIEHRVFHQTEEQIKKRIKGKKVALVKRRTTNG